MKVKDVIRLLEDDGWYLARTRGSHHQFKHSTKSSTVTVSGKAKHRCAARNAEQYSEAGGLRGAERGSIMRYAVIVEEGKNSFGAHVPDLPGCVAVADTKQEVLQLIQEAIEFHLEGLREEGQPIPEPSSSVEYVEIRAA